MTTQADYEAALAIATSLATTMTADMSQTVRVSITSLASVAVELANAKAHVTELQTHNTALLERARRAECERDAAAKYAVVTLECAERMCADYRAEIDSMHDIIEAPDSEVVRLEAEVEAMARQVRDTLADLASVTMSRDALASPLNSIDEYQRAAMRTTIHARGEAGVSALTWNALGIAGEAGEVADMIKKHVGHGHALDRTKLTRELGDVLWYVAALAHDIGVDLSTVARENVEKLKARYPDGFSQERSVNRGDK